MEYLLHIVEVATFIRVRPINEEKLSEVRGLWEVIVCGNCSPMLERIKGK